MSIQRYDLYEESEYPWHGSMHEMPETGDYVLYADHAAEVARLETVIIDLQTAMRSTDPIQAANCRVTEYHQCKEEVARLEREIDQCKIDLNELLIERDELQHTFDMVLASIERGTKQWRQATGRTEKLPDLGNLVEWCLSERDAAVARAERAEEALRHTCEHLCQWKGACEVGCPVSIALAAAQDAKPAYRAMEPEQGGPKGDDA